MASIFDQFLAGQERGRAQRKENQLNTLSAQAFGAAPDQQRGLIQQAIANDAGSGFALNKNLEADQDRQRAQLSGAAKFMKQALDTNNPMAIQGAWKAVLPGLVRQGIIDPAQASPDWRPEYEPLLHQVLAMTGTGGGANFASSFIDANGDRIAIMRDGSQVNMGQNAPTNKIFDTGDGVVGIDTRSLNARPVVTGSPSAAPNAPTMPATTGASQFTLDDASLDAIRSLPANERAAALQAMLTGGDFQAGANGQAVPGLSTPPQQLRTAPKPTDTPENFVPVTAAEAAQLGLPPGTVAQRSTKTGKIDFGPASMQSPVKKPLPATALRLIKEETDAMDAAGTMDTILERVNGRIERGELRLGLAQNLEARARNFTGANDTSSRNFQSFISDLNRARNQSLLLNKGVQTEGDAQRAWDELMKHVNDPEFVKQRIKEIKEINALGILHRKANVDMIRQNFGGEPMDFGAREGAGPSPNGATPPTAPKRIRIEF